MSSNIKQDISNDSKDVGSPSQNWESEQGAANEPAGDVSAVTRGNRGRIASLSKREIMEQLSRERFPWDE
jgi:hypothetical protein